MKRTHRSFGATGTASAIAALVLTAAACSTGHHRAAPPDNSLVSGASSPAASSAASAAASSLPASSLAASSASTSSATGSPSTTSSAKAAATKSTAPATPKPTAATPPAKPTTAPKPTTPAPPPVKASGSDVLAGTSCQVFPADNYWHADIASLPVDVHSAAWLSAMGGSTRKLHPDFGPSGDTANPYGIPVTVVPAGQTRVPVTFQYADESDPLKYPLGANTKIEGGANSGGDMHAIMVTADTCELFETWDTSDTASGWTAGSGAHWSLSSDALRPNTWTSADAAGLPILPGLLRYDEVASGHVDHAIRFTTNVTDDSFLWPARHAASSNHNTSLPPMGARFRLKASFSLAGYSAQTQTVLRAMQTYGLVLADNGSPWYFQGTADNAWPDTLISQLKTIPASAFEAVDTSSLEISANSGAAR
jgi:hypothetical protein